MSKAEGKIKKFVQVKPDKADFKTGIRWRLTQYLASVVLIWAVILLFNYVPYYNDFIYPQSLRVMEYLAYFYTLLAIIYYLFIPKRLLSLSRGYIVLRGVYRLFCGWKDYIANFTRKPGYPWVKLEEADRVALLFVVVKIIYLPLMLNFIFINYNALTAGLDASHASPLLSVTGFNLVIFPVLVASVFLLDTIIFAFGYTFESRLLNNKVRSVEPTITGWIVALVCYAPLYVISSQFAPFFQDDSRNFSSPTTNFAAHLLVLLFLFIYVAASVALGPKASNLTNRGIVGYGPYRWVRHPAYIAKNIGWWISIIPIFRLSVALAMAAWSFIYFMRSITEERHLIRDPDYQEYVKKVRYRFIPGVY